VPYDTNSHSFYTTNINLMVDAKVSDALRGFIELESASGNGNNPNSGVYIGVPTAAVMIPSPMQI